jgi:hypothetical protein
MVPDLGHAGWFRRVLSWHPHYPMHYTHALWNTTRALS